MPILPTSKHTLTYLEHCRIVMSDERLAYLKAEGAVEKAFSLPYGNLNALLLGPGTSITHQAARLLGDTGVLLGFTGGGGTPLYLTSVNEYRPTEYCQAWCGWWFDDAKRLVKAKQFQHVRVDFVLKHWPRGVNLLVVEAAAAKYRKELEAASTTTELLLSEARFSKTLYAQLAQSYGVTFTRNPRAGDTHNELLDMGNYLAYGLAACSLWVLGIPTSMALTHGKPRRGALVFDVADLIKDAIIMPTAFEAAHRKRTSGQARADMLVAMENKNVLKFMLEALVNASEA